MKTVYGCKILHANHTSLMHRYKYHYGWNSVPGDGAYIAVTGGVDVLGFIPPDAVVRWFRCDVSSEAVPQCMPIGVRCFNRVYMLRRRPAGIKYPPAVDKRGFITTCAIWGRGYSWAIWSKSTGKCTMTSFNYARVRNHRRNT